MQIFMGLFLMVEKDKKDTRRAIEQKTSDFYMFDFVDCFMGCELYPDSTSCNQKVILEEVV